MKNLKNNLNKKLTDQINNSIQTMIAGLAHEIRNPLNSIKGASEYLNKKYSNLDDVKEFTDIIINEIERLDKYLNEFLSFSRGVKLKLKKVNLENFLSGIIMTIKHSIPVDVGIFVEKNLPDIYIDPEQMRQVIVNLLSNAKDAIINIKNPEIKIIARKIKNKVHISIIDNGHGIKSDDINSIFVPFWTTKENGLGLGLAICKSIIEKHKGNISVRSKLNKGSEFIISLPLIEQRK
ncbi:MAG: HAMP domain-containing histidine kinase [Candidatus Goldbacteria bacterium]|nr:HAMP domain-containing histidine kinase [Candidatus Goldiibacteriota bacterium]